MSTSIDSSSFGTSALDAQQMPGNCHERRLNVLLRQLTSSQSQLRAAGRIIIVGGAVLDIQAQPDGPSDLQRGTSVPGKARHVPGGVGRNIAEALSLLVPTSLPPPMLASLLGSDAAGSFLLSQLQSLRLDLSLVAVQADMATPCVVAAFDRSGEVAACVADVHDLERCLTPQLVSQLLLSPPQPPAAPAPHTPHSTPSQGVTLPQQGGPIPHAPLHSASLLLVEANLSEAAIAAACAAASSAGVPVFLEPVSVPKSVRAASVLHQLSFIKPNAAELAAIAQEVRRRNPTTSTDWQLACQGCGCSGCDCAAATATVTGPGQSGSCSSAAEMQQQQQQPACGVSAVPKELLALLPHAAVLIAAGVQHIVLTLGAQGAALITADHTAAAHQSSVTTSEQAPPAPGRMCSCSSCCQTQAGGRSMRLGVTHMPALPAKVVSLSGAGDTLVAGTTAALVQGETAVRAVAYGMAAAKLAVQSASNVPQGMSFDHLRRDAAEALSCAQHCIVTMMAVTL